MVASACFCTAKQGCFPRPLWDRYASGWFCSDPLWYNKGDYSVKFSCLARAQRRAACCCVRVRCSGLPEAPRTHKMRPDPANTSLFLLSSPCPVPQSGQTKGQPGKQDGNVCRDGPAVVGGSLDSPSDQLVRGQILAGWEGFGEQRPWNPGWSRRWVVGRRTDVSLPSMLIF